MVWAQPVMVNGSEEGQGFLFNESGICYLLTAAHVTDGARRAQVLTEGGSDGTATMMAPFWPGFDVDVGQVRRIDSSECTASFRDLELGSKKSLAGARLVLPLVSRSGIDNYDMHVGQTDYLEFTGQFADGERAGKKGMSGGFAFLGGTPVGLARATDSGGAIKFIQMAEVSMNVRRWLDRASFNSAPVQVELDRSLEGRPYEIISSHPAAVDGSHLIENLHKADGSFAYSSSENAVILLRNIREGRKILSRISVRSFPTEGYSQPNKIRIDLIPREGSRAQFWRADVFPPDGIFDTGPVSVRFAYEIKITLIGARGASPVRIDQVVLD